MNYYEHHIGDYAEATSHLTFVEDAAYSRLIRKYYSTEQPLPADLKAVQRLVGARDRAERQAVEAVLREFFELRDDGWHNTRCDEELARYHAGEPERAARKQHEESRLKRHREERTRMFEALRAVGIAPAWNVPVSELRRLFEQHCNEAATEPETLQQPLPATAPATPATATHTPFPIPQSPDTRHQTPTTNPEFGRKSARATEGNGRLAGEDEQSLNEWRTVEACDAEAMGDWIEHRERKGKPLTGGERIMAAKLLAGMGEAERQRTAVRTAAANGWMNLRPSDGAVTGAAPPPGGKRNRTAAELISWRPDPEEERQRVEGQR